MHCSVTSDKVNKGGRQYVYEQGGVQSACAGVVTDTELKAGGKLVVFHGASVSDVTGTGKATVQVEQGGFINGLSMEAGGTLKLAAGGGLSGTNRLISVTASGGSKTAYAMLSSGAALNLGKGNNMSKLCLSIANASLAVDGTGNKLQALATDINSAITFDVSGLSASGKTLMLAVNTS